MNELFLLVGGWPGSGKSTLALALAAELDLPLLAKDEIKEALADGLGPPADVAASQRLGRAAAAWIAVRPPARSLVHSDFRPDNLMFGADRGGPTVAAVDWQGFGAGCAM